jgi:hypothetical protein
MMSQLQDWNSPIVEGAKMFMPDLLTPQQFFGGLHRKCGNLEGERRMLEEMLLDAIDCWLSAAVAPSYGGSHFKSSRQRLHREADFWIFGKYNNSPFFSFSHTCDCLGLNADFVRRRLLEWRRVLTSPSRSSLASPAQTRTNDPRRSRQRTRQIIREILETLERPASGGIPGNQNVCGQKGCL